MGKLFGTDGIRGVVGENLTADLAFRTGKAIAAVLKEEKGRKPAITIGKDTRISSDMLESALIAGICSVGGDVMPFGVLPTPAVAYLTVLKGADAGIVISASHNPYEHNGIKVFNEKGYKLPDAIEEQVEEKNSHRHLSRRDARRDRCPAPRSAAVARGVYRPFSWHDRRRPVRPARAGRLLERRVVRDGTGALWPLPLLL